MPLESEVTGQNRGQSQFFALKNRINFLKTDGSVDERESTLGQRARRGSGDVNDREIGPIEAGSCQP